MKTLRSFTMLVGLATLINVGAPSVLAQKGGCCETGRGIYDQTTEMKLQAIIDEVEQVSCGGGCMTGMYLVVRSDKDRLEVRLGPSDFLAKKEFNFAKGDAVEITGSKVKCMGEEFLLARAIKKGDRSLTLRDAQGIPADRVETPGRTGMTLCCLYQEL
jgi:hypothetical protein